MANLNVKDIPSLVLSKLLVLKKYLVFIFIMFILLIYGYLVFHISNLAKTEPDEAAIADRLKTVQRPKIDKDALNKIQQLEDQNIQVQTLFQQARENPFTE